MTCGYCDRPVFADGPGHFRSCPRFRPCARFKLSRAVNQPPIERRLEQFCECGGTRQQHKRRKST